MKHYLYLNYFLIFDVTYSIKDKYKKNKAQIVRVDKGIILPNKSTVGLKDYQRIIVLKR